MKKYDSNNIIVLKFFVGAKMILKGTLSDKKKYYTNQIVYIKDYDGHGGFTLSKSQDPNAEVHRCQASNLNGQFKVMVKQS